MTSETVPLTERLVTRLAGLGQRRASRRSVIGAATLAGTALALDPWGYVTKPQSAYASVCGPGATCDAGWSAFCCSIHDGRNTCPPNTYAGGWWKADRSSFCGGAARYYIDCNAKPGQHFHCRCNQSNCDHRYVACNVFRYGQCNTQVEGVTAVVCRQISCLPPWQLYPGECGTSSATDNNTAKHSAPCLTKANSNPNLVTFAKGSNTLLAGKSLRGGGRLVSTDRHTEAVFGTDGNLVLRNQHGTIWQTKTAGTAKGGRLYLRPDGAILLYDAAGAIAWRTYATELSAPKLAVRSNGQLAVMQGSTVAWHTNTHTP